MCDAAACPEGGDLLACRPARAGDRAGPDRRARRNRDDCLSQWLLEGLAECQVPINTHALQYGTGCFEGVRGYWDGTRTNLLFLREHFERLDSNARMLFMQSPGVDEMCEICVKLIRDNDLKANVYIRPVVFKCSTNLGPKLKDEPDGFMMYCMQLGDYLDTAKGLEVCVSSWVRLDDNAIPTRAKATGGYLNSAPGPTEAQVNGYDEAIFLNRIRPGRRRLG